MVKYESKMHTGGEEKLSIGFFSMFDTENHDVFTLKEEQDSPLTNT